MTLPRETKSQLARRLKIHRHALDAFLARPGAPSPDKGKRYDPAAVASFVGQQKEDGGIDTLRAARLTEIKLRCEGLRRQLARDDKQVMMISEVNKLLQQVGVKLRYALLTGTETELPPKLDGLPAMEARRILRDWCDDVFRAMQGAIDQSALTFGFTEGALKFENENAEAKRSD
jgi:hypothetical protein